MPNPFEWPPPGWGPTAPDELDDWQEHVAPDAMLQEEPQWPPPGFAPDAVSGAAPEPEPQEEPFVPNPVGAFGQGAFQSEALRGAPEQLGGAELDTAPPEQTPEDELILDRRLGEAARTEEVALGDLNPEGLAEEFARRDFEKAQHFRRRRDELEAEADERREAERLDNQSYLAEARAEAEQLRMDARELSDTGIDKNHWFTDEKSGGPILSIFAFLIGGFAAAKTGVANPTTKLLMNRMNRDLEIQKANIANNRANIQQRRGIVSDMYQRYGDLEKASAAAHLASLNSVAKTLEQEASQYDPEGTKFRYLHNARQEFLGEAAKANAALEGTIYKRNMEVRKQVEVERHNRATEALSAAKLRPRGGGGGARGRGGPASDVVDFNDPDAVRNAFGKGTIGRFRKGTRDVDKSKFRERKVARDGMVREMREIMKEYQVVGKTYGGPGSDRFGKSDRARELQSRYRDAFNRYKKELTGAAANEEEMKGMLETLPNPEGILKANPTGGWTGFLRSAASHQRADYDTYLDRSYDPTDDFLSGTKLASKKRSFGADDQNDVLENDSKASNLTSALNERARQYGNRSVDGPNWSQVVRPGERERLEEAGARAIDAAESPRDKKQAKAAANRAKSAFDKAVRQRETRRRELQSIRNSAKWMGLSYADQQNIIQELELLGGR